MLPVMLTSKHQPHLHPPKHPPAEEVLVCFVVLRSGAELRVSMQTMKHGNMSGHEKVSWSIPTQPDVQLAAV